MVEKVVAELMSTESESRVLLNDRQFGSRMRQQSGLTLLMHREHTDIYRGCLCRIYMYPAHVWQRKAIQHNDGQANEWGPYTIYRELALRKNCADTNHGARDEEAHTGTTCHAVPTRQILSFCNLNFWTEDMGGRVRLS